MRNKVLFLVITAVVLGLAFCLVSCGTTSQSASTDVVIKNLAVTNAHVGEYVIGEDVDFSEIVVTASYSDGSTRTFLLDDTLLSDEDRAAFFVEGVHAVTVRYDGKQAIFQISVVNPQQVTVYCATFYSENGEAPYYVYGTEVTTFRAPQREGYIFAGWYPNYSLTGSRALAPYKLVEDTKFYAKWAVDKVYSVKFFDEDRETLLYETVVEEGESIDYEDKELYPDPQEKEGKVFTGWITTYGNREPIRDEIEIYANYERIRCTVLVEHWDGEKEIKTAETVNYGNKFSLVDGDGREKYILPTREGHTSRWVIYPQGKDTFIEFPDGQDYVTVTGNFTVRAQHDINTYSIVVYNGIEESKQSDADLKSGDLKSEHIYDDPSIFSDFHVNYGGNYLLSNMTQSPYLKEPTEIRGYNTCWCYVITTLTGEIWRNAYNEVWDEATESFVVLPGETRTTNFVLADRDGNYLASVRPTNNVPGDLYDIKGPVTIRAKYYKKEYTVSLRRKVGAQWVTLGSFTEKYRTDFKLYDPEKYPESGFTTAQQVESYYLLHNVAQWSFDTENAVDEKWRSVYFNGGNDDDWNIEWYTSSGQQRDSLVDFSENAGVFGSLEIRDNVDLYCKDIDLRRYTVVLYYGYNFAGTGAYLDGAYDYQAVYHEITETATVDRPTGSEVSVIRRYPAYENKTVAYEFDGWYDYPYEPDGNGEKGDRANFDYRTRNVVYYAHYKCDTTYTVTVYDRTQREKYADTALEGKNFDVGYNTIVYRVPAGTLFTLDMLYKGLTVVNPDSSVSVYGGEYFYDRASYMESVLGLTLGGSRSDPRGPVYDAYRATVLRYDVGGDHDTALANARATYLEKKAVVDNFKKLLTALYTYNYEVDGVPLTEELFLTYYKTPFEECHTIRREVKDVENDIAVLENWATTLLTAQTYYDENTAPENVTDVYGADSGLYKKYSDSARDLNAAYNKDVTDPNEKVKFKFSGWYLDENYSELYCKDMEFEFFASPESFTGARTQLDLYAKWADEEKGSEGLVFKAVYDDLDNIVGVVVVDYMTKAEYEAASFAGCGYNDFTHSEYSVNFDDSDHMPTYLGTNIDLQIPAGHGGTALSPYPVLGVMAGAFSRHGIDIRTVALPDDIQFFEEESFRDCYLTNISGAGNAYITIAQERLLYQTATVSGLYHKVSGTPVEIVVPGNTLVAYAVRFTSTSMVDGTSVTLLAGTEKVGAYAFFAANELKYVDFGVDLVKIGAHAFENSGLSGTDEYLFDTLTLPAVLTEIGESAFANCVGIKEFNLVAPSYLSKIGRDAVTSTAWYTTKKGVVCLNGLVVGVRDCRQDDFVKSGEEFVVEDGMYYYENTYGRIYYEKDRTNSGIVRIDLNSSVKGIADYAFECQTSSLAGMKRVTVALKKVNVDSTFSYGIADCAFRNCAALEEVFLSSALSSTAKVALNAFEGCSQPDVVLEKSFDQIDESWSMGGESWVLHLAI